MLKRIIIVIVALGLVYGGYSLYSAYKNYQLEKQARIARLQAKAEEVKVTTIEGWNISKITAEFDNVGLVTPEDFQNALKDFDSSKYELIKKPKNTSLEGYLFPDTYRFAKNESLESIIGKILDNFTNRLNSIGIETAETNIIIPGFEDLKLDGGDGREGNSLYDVLTLASIIELESGGSGVDVSGISLEEERALIAGVFYNRLDIGQALESDATVNYVTGKKTPGASLKDLEVNSPYNTYRYPGLPPGPIANPSLGSIEAALNPKKSDFYFFLHKQPSGEVRFAKTFDEHIRNKR